MKKIPILFFTVIAFGFVFAWVAVFLSMRSIESSTRKEIEIEAGPLLTANAGRQIVTAILFDMTQVESDSGKKLTLDEIIERCERKDQEIDLLHEVVFKYQDKIIERTCSEFYEFLATEKSKPLPLCDGNILNIPCGNTQSTGAIWCFKEGTQTACKKE